MNRRKNRRLAAIMFTDIVGYTALMQEDERRAALVRARHREVFDRLHHLHAGEILQYFGDGTLSVFQSGVEAVACAIAIQRDLQRDDPVPLRIGLHLGDIVFDGTEIYGDSVNVAARIESAGIGGAILLSGRLNQELKNHPGITTRSLGFFDFKNIIDPVEVFAVSDPGIYLPKREELKGKFTDRKKSIAVLPFINRSPDPENEYFSDGMTEEIINALSKIEGLKVTSRTSSFYFKNKKIPLAEIGQSLNVTTILEGSIRLAGNRMRISAQLVNVAEDVHFWSETFDRSVEDIFAVQDEISLLIADKLREHLGHFEIEGQLVEVPEIPVEVYKRYLQSRYYILKMTKPDLERGLSIAEDILQEHPNFALAQLAMHLGYMLMGTIGWLPSEQAFIKGKPYLDRAIELDENLPECQLNLSYIAFLQQWDLEAAYRHLNKSFEIRPTVEYYQSMASVLVAERKFEAAIHYISTALQIDPFSAINYHLKGFIRYGQEKFEAAIVLFDRALELDATFAASRLYKGQALLLAGRIADGLAHFESLPSDDEQQDVIKLGGTTLAHAASGDAPKAEAGIRSLEAYLDTSLMERSLNLLILCHAMLDRKGKTMDLLRQGIGFRLPMLVYLFADPILKRLRPQSDFQRLMEQVLGKESAFSFTRRKYKKTLLDAADLQRFKAQLEQLMTDQKPYLDPDLSLRSLADQLSIPANYLSQLLNEGFDQNFSEYVNTYRLHAFKAKVVDPKNHHLTILALAYESGFNSKTVFNTFFKKSMGVTPKVYWKQVNEE